MINKDLSSSAEFSAVTKSDSLTLSGSEPCRALYIGVGGDVVVTPAGGGADVTFVGVPGGSILPIQAVMVKNATTAASIVALF